MNAQFKPATLAQPSAPDAAYERSGYQRARGGDPIATLAALGIAGGLIAAFAIMHPTFVAKQKREPIVVTLLEMPSDPPPEPEPPKPDAPVPPPVPTAIVAPPPLVTLAPRPVMSAPPPSPIVTQPAPPKPSAPPAPRGPENAGELSARVISARPPRYPLDSRRAHEEGVVVLSIQLSLDGRVSDISIARSSGSTRLDRAALDAVRDWRWSPVMRDGAPVIVRGVVTIPFILQGGGGRGHGRDGPDGFNDGGPRGHHGGRGDRGPGDGARDRGPGDGARDRGPGDRGPDGDDRT